MTPALIKRVESATGEDRRLDAYIFSAFHREPIEPAQTWSVMDSFQFRFTDGRKNALYVHEDDVPAYSSSLDAAVSLCERATGCASWRVGNTPSGRGFAYVGTSLREHDAATPALALVLAVLMRAVTP